MAPDYTDHAARFKAIAHPIRLQILDMLRQGEVCVCHMEAVIDRRQAYISQQLMILREAGLVNSRKEGLKVFYRLCDDLTLALLETALGPPPDAELPVEGCPCPHCCPEVVPES